MINLIFKILSIVLGLIYVISFLIPILVIAFGNLDDAPSSRAD